MPLDTLAPKDSIAIGTEARLAKRWAGFPARPAHQWICVSLLLVIAILRIVSTYHVFNHTIDEPSHIACGVEWWEKGTYTIETKHTPLARIMVAMGPYLSGARGTGAKTWTETFPILSATGHYWRTLTLGRIGVLPFFIVASIVVFLWTRRLFGAIAGLVATAIFTLLPTILAHSTFATTDMALTAMFCCAMYAFTLWLDDPRPRNAVLFGVFIAFALCAKFSTLVFFPACALPILVMYAAAGRRNWRGLLRSIGIAAICAFAVTWAVYRFSHAPLAQVTGIPDRFAVKVLGKHSHGAALIHQVAMHLPVPAPEVLDGIRTLRNQNNEGSRGYLFGHAKDGGWWYFFFVALAVKTPLAVLVLAALGAVAVLFRYRKNRQDWESLAPLVCLAVLMIVTTPARLDSGIRYVMPVFVFISTLAAYGAVTLWERRSHHALYRSALGILLLWLVVSSARSHPDYLSYFNELAGSDPSKIMVVGDLDWGQDLTRLAAYLHDHSVDHLSMSYAGYYLPQPLDLPDTQHLRCNQTASGWVAIELRQKLLYPECYQWLSPYSPVAKVGKTMLVYHFPQP